MFLEMQSNTFNRNDHSLNMHIHGSHYIANFKEIRSNRALIQSYMFRIQSRINRGYIKQATYLFNRMIEITQIPYWAVCALKQELKRPNN